MPPALSRSVLLAASAALGLALPAAAQDDDGAPAARKVYFGDLHVHTRLSFDGANVGITMTADDAYRFARGETVEYRGRQVRRNVPLDFLAVTDHSEYMGMVVMARDPDGPFADSGWPAIMASDTPEAAAQRRRFALSGFYGEAPIPEFLTPELKSGVWQGVIGAAEAANAPGAFTSFVAYEWSPMPGPGNHLHRNVIFRGPEYPALPWSSVDSQRPEDLWTFIEAERARGVEAVLIPHNPNLSGGLTFADADSDGEPIDRDYAEMRARNEPLVEVSQVKGTSETHPELSPGDPFADFEILEHIREGARAPLPGGYVRDAYRRGLEIGARTGVNPFAFGLVGASDSHSALSGTEEDNYTGMLGDPDDPGEAERVLTEFSPILSAPIIRISASGLTGVWAEENTRESLFAALRRREVFATSGPRIQVRLFAGWNYREAQMDQADWVDAAYATGFAMGSDVTGPAPGAGPLRFLVEARMDPLGANLDRIQIVKVWRDADGSHEKIFDVAWSGDRAPDASGAVPPVGSTVDVATASYANDIGAASLAASWVDPEFDPAEPAIYYARVLEIPTPRWPTYLAVRNGLPVPDTVPPTLQERAWTSPIFYRPGG